MRRIILLLVGLTVLLPAFAGADSKLETRGPSEEYLMFRRIEDYIRERDAGLHDISPKELQSAVPGVKRVNRLDKGFYVISTEVGPFLLGIPEDLPPKRAAQRSVIDCGDIVLCDARPQGFFKTNAAGSEKFMSTSVLCQLRPGSIRGLPPVPGCIYHVDRREGKHKVEYPEVAVKRFQMYYPELKEELAALENVVTIPPRRLDIAVTSVVPIELPDSSGRIVFLAGHLDPVFCESERSIRFETKGIAGVVASLIYGFSDTVPAMEAGGTKIDLYWFSDEDGRGRYLRFVDRIGGECLIDLRRGIARQVVRDGERIFAGDITSPVAVISRQGSDQTREVFVGHNKADDITDVLDLDKGMHIGRIEGQGHPLRFIKAGDLPQQ